MRKGIDGLCLLLSEQNVKPQTGGLYLFSNRIGRILKGLIWDRNGFILISKRIEGSRFKIRFDASIHEPFELDREQLKWLLAGLDYEQQSIFPALKIEHFY